MALVPFLVSPQLPRQKQATTEGIPWPQAPGDKGALPSEAHFKSPSWHGDAWGLPVSAGVKDHATWLPWLKTHSAPRGKVKGYAPMTFMTFMP